MQVREQNVDRAREGTRQLEPEQADAGAGIEDQRGVVGEHERQAGGVPAVADGVRARSGQRAAAAANGRLHSRSGSQKSMKTPSSSSPPPSSGVAVTDSVVRRPSAQV